VTNAATDRTTAADSGGRGIRVDVRKNTVLPDLLTEAVARFGTHELRVTGHSMLPALWPGDRITLATTSAASVAQGDIVAVRQRNGLVVHRVVQAMGAAGEPLITRGDRLTYDDPVVGEDALVGRVVDVRRGPLRIPRSGSSGLVWHLLAHGFEWAHAARLRLATVRQGSTP
jgi:hypothetical protein